MGPNPFHEDPSTFLGLGLHHGAFQLQTWALLEGARDCPLGQVFGMEP
jgi:hypothetical protein